jgi:hypothetical protein
VACAPITRKIIPGISAAAISYPLTLTPWRIGARRSVAKDADLDTDEGIRAALISLRFRAENNFAVKLQPALQQYTKANNGQPPGNLADLTAYITPPVDNANAILERYQILDTGMNVAGGWSGGWVIAQKKAVDPDRDFRWLSAFKAPGK